ncbi:hypothetical protein GCM10028805_03590 [Spirosoma harenae]
MTLNRHLLCSLVVLLTILTCKGQVYTVSGADSLLRYLHTAKQDTTYIRAACQYAQWLYRLRELDRADSLLKRTETLAMRLQDTMGLQRVFFHFGNIYMLRPGSAHLPKARAYFEKARQLIIRNHLPSGELLLAITGLGDACYFSHQHEPALKHFLASIRLAERYHLTNNTTRAYLGVSEIMGILGRDKERDKYAQKAYAIAYHDQNKMMIFWAEGTMTALLKRQHKYQEAINHLAKVLPYTDQFLFQSWKINIYLTIGDCYNQLNQPANALHALKLAEHYAQEASFRANDMDRLNTSFALGQYYLSHQNYQQAEPYFLKSLKIARQLKEPLDELDASEGLSKVYAAVHQYDKAYRFQMAFSRLNDSLFSYKATQKTRDLLAKAEAGKRDAQVRLLNQQKQSAQFQRNAFIIGGLLILILGALFSAWLLNRARLRRLQEAHTLRQQIAHDLHDEVGSTISSISMLSGHTDALLKQNQPESAQKMVHKIYTDARQILESIDEIIWTINPGNDSLHRIALRLQEYAQPLMESKGIVFHFSVDSSLDNYPVSMEVRRNLYLIGKEAINNLIKYSQATQATLRVELQNDQLRVLIEDNGRGFNTAQASPRNGQRSMQQRAVAMGGLLAVQSTPGQGTRLQLIMNP